MALSEDTKTGEGRPVWLARTITLALGSETSLLVNTSPSGVAKVSPMQGLKKHSIIMTAFGHMNVFPSRPSKLVVSNAGITVVKFAKDQRIAVTKGPPVVFNHYKHDEASPYSPAFEDDESMNDI